VFQAVIDTRESLMDRYALDLAMTKEEVAAFFARRAEAFDRHDADTLGADYSVDCVVESRLYGTTIGRDANTRLFRTLFAAFPDFKIQPEDLLIFGDRVVQTVTSSGTDTGGFHGHPPTGRPFSVLSIFLFTIANHQIVHERRIYDSSGLLLQLAGQSGLVSDSARIYREALERARQEQELRMAAQIQRALAPERHYKGTGFELAAASVPCRAIGGDLSITSICRTRRLVSPSAT
jgi:steroid delta-isomerase-like uncharacterized protein